MADFTFSHHHKHKYLEALIPKNWYDQDITYAYNLDVSDFTNSRIEQIFAEIKKLNHSIAYSKKPNKIKKRNHLIEELELIGRRFYLDQTVYDENKNKILKPLSKARKVDRVTVPGMARMASIFAGESSGFYLWMVNGGSKIAAEVTDWRLYQEFATTSVQDNGYASGSGTVIKHGAAFSINDPDNTIYEVGVRDFPNYNNDQTLWFRSVFDEPGEEVEHLQGKDVVIISHAAHLISVTDFEEQIDQNVI